MRTCIGRTFTGGSQTPFLVPSPLATLALIVGLACFISPPYAAAQSLPDGDQIVRVLPLTSTPLVEASTPFIIVPPDTLHLSMRIIEPSRSLALAMPVIRPKLGSYRSASVGPPLFGSAPKVPEPQATP